MPGGCAPMKYVRCRVTTYRASLLDLRWSRAIHSCERCVLGPPKAGAPSPCKAVHYGMCTPVTLAIVTSNGPKTQHHTLTLVPKVREQQPLLFLDPYNAARIFLNI